MAVVNARHTRSDRNLNWMPFRVNNVGWWRYRIAVIATSGRCTLWQDQSGLGHDLVQAVTANAPVVTSDGSLQFDGVLSVMKTANFTLSQPFTVYMAFQQDTSVNAAVIFDGTTGTTSFKQATGNVTGINGGSALGSDATLVVGSRGVSAVVFNSTSSVLQNGGGATTVTTSGSAGSNNAGGFTLGASRSTANYSKILVREIAIFSVAHDDDSRLKMLRYFSKVGNVGGV